jgi:hypothetical protein
MESHKRMRTPVDVDRERPVVRDVIPSDIEWGGMGLEIHDGRNYIAHVLTPRGVETWVNAELLARYKVKRGICSHVPSGEASAVNSVAKAELDGYRHTADILYKIS